jgi:tRNA(fMet)-specific endonuclease VapC
MSLYYLLDTNTLSEPLRKSPNLAVLKKIQSHQTEMATAALVLYEMIRGAHRLPEQTEKRVRILQYADKFIRANLPILPYTETTALWHGTEVARLIMLGKTPSPIDSQIAAIAKTNNLILVTRNVKDFDCFTDLRIENWFDG